MSYILRSCGLSLKLTGPGKRKGLGVALYSSVSMRLSQIVINNSENLPPVCSFFSFLSLDLRCGLCTWSSMFACDVFTNSQGPSN